MANGLPPIFSPDMLEPEPIPDPRLAQGMESVPPPDFMPEVPQYIPPTPPGMFENTFSPFGNTAALTAMMRRGAPPGAFLLAGFLHGMGLQAQRKRAVDEEQRQEMNRRFETAAAFRNRANLAASGRREATRLDQMQKASERERVKAERAAERRIITPQMASSLQLPPAEWVGKSLDDLPPELRGRIAPQGSGFMADVMADTDPKAIAQAIRDNRFPPDLSGFGRYVQGQVASELAKTGYNLTRASADWKAANRFYSSLNTSLQLRLRQAIENAYETSRVASGLHDELNTLIPRGQFTAANKALRVLAQEGAYGPEATASVQKLVSFVNALQFELANVYMGGGVPTDVAQEKAHQIVNPDMSPVRLRAALQAAEQELGIRRLAIQQAGMVSPSNPPTGIPQTDINIGDNPMSVAPKTVRMVAPDGRLLNVPHDKVAEAEKRGARRQ